MTTLSLLTIVCRNVFQEDGVGCELVNTLNMITRGVAYFLMYTGQYICFHL